MYFIGMYLVYSAAVSYFENRSTVIKFVPRSALVPMSLMAKQSKNNDSKSQDDDDPESQAPMSAVR